MMARQDRRAYMREYRLRRKQEAAANRSERMTITFTADELAKLKAYAADGPEPEYPDHATLADVVRHALLLSAVQEADQKADPGSESAYVEWVERQSDGSPCPLPRYGALLDACSASRCHCPIHSAPGGRTLRACEANGGTARWSLGRDPASGPA